MNCRAFTLLLSVSLGGIIGAVAPAGAVPTRGPEVNASANPQSPYSETSVAISPHDPRTIVVGSNRIAGDGHMPVFVSTDRGATYTHTSLPNNISGVTYHVASDPSVAFDGAGNAYYGYMLSMGSLNEPFRPVVAVLPVGQSQWEGPFSVTAEIGDDDKPWLAVDAGAGSPYQGRVYMAWDRNYSNNSQAILLSHSNDGLTWTAPIRIDDPATSSGYVIYTHIAVGPDGEAYVVWNDYGVSDGGSLRIDRSLNGGTSFGNDVVVTDLRLNLQPDVLNPTSLYTIPAQPTRGIAACPSVGVDTSHGPRRGWVYVCYCDRATGKSHDDVDVFVRRSSDDGATWGAPVRVNDDATDRSQFFPWLSVDPVDGSLNVAFYDCRNDPANAKADVYYARSLDGGASFEPNFRVTTVPSNQSTGSGDPAGNDYGDYLGMAASGGVVVPAWTDSRGGYNQAYTAMLVQPANAPVGLTQTARGLNIPTGASLGTGTVTLAASLSGPSPELNTEWEIKPFDVPFDGAGILAGGRVAFDGSTAPVAWEVTGLAAGAYHWRVRANRADGLGAPGDWTANSTETDFQVGQPLYTAADAANALKIAAGLLSATAADVLRLDVTTPWSAASVGLPDAVKIIRASAGLDSIP